MTTPNAMHETLAELIGTPNVVSESHQMANYVEEPRRLYNVLPSLVVTPTCVSDVQEIMRWANANKVSVVPQGGNTGLVGGQVALLDTEIILSLKKL